MNGLIAGYYDRLELLRDELAANGLEDWSRELLSAERSACTSGEVISNTGVVLRRLGRSSDLTDTGLRERVESAIAQGARIWRG
jgi:hypothetical protein